MKKLNLKHLIIQMKLLIIKISYLKLIQLIIEKLKELELL